MQPPINEDQPSRSSMLLSVPLAATVFVGLLVATLLGVALLSAPEVRLTRLLTVGLIFTLLGLALFDHFYEILQTAQAWRTLAERTGLTCRVNGFFLTGYSVEVSGTYKGHRLSLYIYKQGKSQVPSTKIEVFVNNELGATLRLRGPFEPGAAQSDKVVSQMFEATEARQFGDNRRFFIRSHPVHLVTSMFRPGPLRDKLLQLEDLVNIELEGQLLHCNQLGVIGDADYLHSLFDLLSDLADAVEKGGYVKLTSSAKKTG